MKIELDKHELETILRAFSERKERNEDKIVDTLHGILGQLLPRLRLINGNNDDKDTQQTR